MSCRPTVNGFARLAAAVIAHALIGIDPQFPAVDERTRAQLQERKKELEAEAPRGAPADPAAPAGKDGSDRPHKKNKRK